MRKYLIISVAVLFVLFSIHVLIMYVVPLKVDLNKIITFSDIPADIEEKDLRIERDETFQSLGPVRAMRETNPFDEEAMSWSNVFDIYGSGLVVFDANDDGLLDAYFCNNGQSWTRATNENGVLLDEPRYQHNALYLNQGIDGDGNPTYVQVKVLAGTNDKFVEEELVVENYLFPRQNVSDSEKRWGRMSGGAVAADFNGDGRPDLLVGNYLTGMMWTDPATQRIIPPFISPDGREARYSRQPLVALGMYFINYQPRENTWDQRESSRGKEFFGANSLFLNMGDKDGDGIPEWKDVSRSSGIEGQRATTTFSVMDIDLDGDLDVFAGSAMDPDYWPGGSMYWAGGANQIYVNQLSETGNLKFINKTDEMNISGLYSPDNPKIEHEKLRLLPFLPKEYSLIFRKIETYTQEGLVINGIEAEQAQITWASIFQDVNDDGFPDIWVANDMADLELFVNQQGKGFKKTDNLRSKVTGNWMSFAAADYNGDLTEDLFVGNLGGGIFSGGFIPNAYSLLEPVMSDTVFFSLFVTGHHDVKHVFIDGGNFQNNLIPLIQHSSVLPPDASIPNNRMRFELPWDYEPEINRHSIDPYEFVWGSVAFDIQNDGLQDLYFVGNLFSRAGGILSVMSTCPGRMLVNATKKSDQMRFVDLTAEHHLFNIKELKYDRLESDGYIYRKAPTKNWVKRDTVYSYDRSSWLAQGRPIKETIVNQDLIQTTDNGRVVVSADLNGDGFKDLILRNVGGYDSRSSKAKNLKGRTVSGHTAVLSAHENNYPVLTNFEPGSTRVFINTYKDNHWLTVKLVDDTEGSFNRDAIGAKVVLNDQYIKVKRATQGTLIGNHLTDMHFGLGKGLASKIQVTWPDKERTVTTHTLDQLKNGKIIIIKTRTTVQWEPGSSEKG